MIVTIPSIEVSDEFRKALREKLGKGGLASREDVRAHFSKVIADDIAEVTAGDDGDEDDGGGEDGMDDPDDPRLDEDGEDEGSEEECECDRPSCRICCPDEDS